MLRCLWYVIVLLNTIILIGMENNEIANTSSSGSSDGHQNGLVNNTNNDNVKDEKENDSDGYSDLEAEEVLSENLGEEINSKTQSKVFSWMKFDELSNFHTTVGNNPEKALGIIKKKLSASFERDVFESHPLKAVLDIVYEKQLNEENFDNSLYKEIVNIIIKNNIDHCIKNPLEALKPQELAKIVSEVFGYNIQYSYEWHDLIEKNSNLVVTKERLLSSFDGKISNSSLLEFFRTYPNFVFIKDEQGNTPLLLSFAHNCPDNIKLLILQTDPAGALQRNNKDQNVFGVISDKDYKERDETFIRKTIACCKISEKITTIFFDNLKNGEFSNVVEDLEKYPQLAYRTDKNGNLITDYIKDKKGTEKIISLLDILKPEKIIIVKQDGRKNSAPKDNRKNSISLSNFFGNIIPVSPRNRDLRKQSLINEEEVKKIGKQYETKLNKKSSQNSIESKIHFLSSKKIVNN